MIFVLFLVALFLFGQLCGVVLLILLALSLKWPRLRRFAWPVAIPALLIAALMAWIELRPAVHYGPQNDAVFARHG